MTKRDMTLLGSRLRRLRLDQGLTQQELAEPRYTHAYVSTIEAGKRAPSDMAIQHFAAKLDVHPDQLRTGRPANIAPQIELRLQEARSLISAGQIVEARTTLADALRDARRFALVQEEAVAHEHLALLHEREGDLDAAIKEYEAAQHLLRNEPLHFAADAVAGKARCFHLRGDKTHSIYLLETFIHSLKERGLPDPDALIRLYTSLLTTYVAAGFLTQAGDMAREALGLEERVEDPARRAAMHNMVARVLLDRGEIKAAQDSLKRARHFYRIADLEVEMGRAHLAYGIFLSRGDKIKPAIKELRAALAIFERTRSTLDEGRACNELGRVERESGREETARALLERALQLLEGADPGELALTYRELALVERNANPESAESAFKRAIELFLLAEERAEAAVTYAYLGDLRVAAQGHDACHTYRDGLALLERTSSTSPR